MGSFERQNSNGFDPMGNSFERQHSNGFDPVRSFERRNSNGFDPVRSFERRNSNGFDPLGSFERQNHYQTHYVQEPDWQQVKSQCLKILKKIRVMRSFKVIFKHCAYLHFLHSFKVFLSG